MSKLFNFRNKKQKEWVLNMAANLCLAEIARGFADEKTSEECNLSEDDYEEFSEAFFKIADSLDRGLTATGTIEGNLKAAYDFYENKYSK